ncbi:DNA (cytosine-5-)-methyltransferase [Bacillus subtilis]|uniref:DNA (cytosine-5-)-methyltransferase n=1 Tax=Bacillus subtilis TaxID=1423 RepID=UPI001B9DB4F0|nr:DNA (cytosine-5-)-methyltransferase [Bacillus subtilis]CAF1851235.1 Modification methylase HhaI [Bacillus subtilis]CAF1914740.1 Modification methylase HhaI [Bacillus subtilis]CAF1916846.1 Modification methylase HhaI [Bacillus subtilis]
MNKLRVMSLFSGIGAFEAALRNIGVEYELVGFSEIDKYAIKSYCAIHNVDEQLNYGDVSKIDKTFLPEFDLLVGGSPCQSFSIAGHRRGLNRNQKQNAVVEVRAVLTPDREEKRQNGRRFKDDGEPAFTVNTIDRHGVAIGEYPKYRIRKFTPLECFRLQAFDDEDFEKTFAAGISNSQLYKQAGNSITVTVLESIFKELIHTYFNKESE